MWTYDLRSYGGVGVGKWSNSSKKSIQGYKKSIQGYKKSIQGYTVSFRVSWRLWKNVWNWKIFMTADMEFFEKIVIKNFFFPFRFQVSVG